MSGGAAAAPPSHWALEMEDLRVENIRLRLRHMYLEEVCAMAHMDAELAMEAANAKLAAHEARTDRDALLARVHALEGDLRGRNDTIAQLRQQVLEQTSALREAELVAKSFRELEEEHKVCAAVRDQLDVTSLDLAASQRHYGEVQRLNEQLRSRLSDVESELRTRVVGAAERERETEAALQRVMAAQARLEEELRSCDTERAALQVRLNEEREAGQVLREETRKALLEARTAAEVADAQWQEAKTALDDIVAEQKLTLDWATREWLTAVNVAFAASNNTVLLLNGRDAPTNLCGLRRYLTATLDDAALTVKRQQCEAVERLFFVAQLPSTMDRLEKLVVTKIQVTSERLLKCTTMLQRTQRRVRGRQSASEKLYAEATAAHADARRLQQRCEALEANTWRDMTDIMQKSLASACAEARRAAQQTATETMSELHTRVLRSNVITEEFAGSIRSTAQRVISMVQDLTDSTLPHRRRQLGDVPADALLPPRRDEGDSNSTMSAYRTVLEQLARNTSNIATLLDNNLKQTSEVIVTLEDILDRFRSEIAQVLSAFDGRAKLLVEQATMVIPPHAANGIVSPPRSASSVPLRADPLAAADVFRLSPVNRRPASPWGRLE